MAQYWDPKYWRTNRFIAKYEEWKAGMSIRWIAWLLYKWTPEYYRREISEWAMEEAKLYIRDCKVAGQKGGRPKRT